jgi:hypothetical protein
LWAATGIDQVYPENYERAQTDLEANDDFHGLTSLQDTLAFDVLDAGMSIAPNMVLVNEPMLISDGHNSDIRYNFFYPRWAYDEYRCLQSTPRRATGIISTFGISSLRLNLRTAPSI